MNKNQLIFFTLALSFSCGTLVSLPATAIEEVVTEETIVTGDEDPSNGDGDVFFEDDTAVSEEEASIEQACDEAIDDNCNTESELKNALDEGLANEPEVICATEDEEGCGETDSEMWPLYVSLGALAATILLVIIINLIGRRKK